MCDIRGNPTFKLIDIENREDKITVINTGNVEVHYIDNKLIDKIKVNEGIGKKRSIKIEYTDSNGKSITGWVSRDNFTTKQIEELNDAYKNNNKLIQEEEVEDAIYK